MNDALLLNVNADEEVRQPGWRASRLVVSIIPGF